MAAKGHPPLVFVDSCVYLDLVVGRTDLCPSTGRKRSDLARDLFDLVDGGKIRLASSSLIQAEVLHNGDTRKQGELVKKRLLGWFRSPATAWTDVDRLLAEEAVSAGVKYGPLRYDKKKRLGSADAIHLASGERLKCSYFLTQDTGMPIGQTINGMSVEFSGPVGEFQLALPPVE